MNITSKKHDARIAEAHRTFLSKTEGLKGTVLMLRLTALAKGMPGLGAGQIDPYIQGMAKETLDGLNLASRINGAVEEHRTLSAVDPEIRVPSNPHYHTERLARLQEIEEQVEADRNKLEALSRNDRSAARANAVAAYDAADAASARVAEIRSAAEAQVAAEPVTGNAVSGLAATLRNQK